MKTLAIYRPKAQYKPAPMYPNAATRRETVNKLLDRLLIGAMAVAAVAVLLFFCNTGLIGIV